jgi:hypothetical protein|tara:strand:- start:348 stop:980 length:633 start_codon:yes stop_codon:yes gene_type:complete
MPLPILALAAIQAAPSIIEGATSLIGAKQQQREIKEREQKALAAMERSRARYEQQDITNPFANMTVNTQQAEFQAAQSQQATANTLQALRGAAGGSGIAALAQAAIGAQADTSRQISADIGAQEQANQVRIATGEQERQRREADLRGTLLGMDQAEAAEAITARQANQQAITEGIGQIAGGVTKAALSYGGAKAAGPDVSDENIIKMFMQ